MARNLLLTYHPLAVTPAGRIVARFNGRLPFEDGSIRTEPNLRHEVPSVTGLCRGGLVVRRVSIGSQLVYVTVKRQYVPGQPSCQHLTAILEVREVLEDHKQAAKWYENRGFAVPKNCIFSSHLPAEQAMFGYNRGERRFVSAAEAEAKYQERGRSYPQYILCRTNFLELVNPPFVDLKAMGISPNSTQAGKQLSEAEVFAFLRVADSHR